MIHDPELTDQLSGFPESRFEGHAFRVTGTSADPIAVSISGGRWAPRPDQTPGVSVLYLSLERDGAIAEVVSYLAEQTPRPAKPVRVHELVVSTSKTLTLVRANLVQLGVVLDRYGERNYEVTQKIGAAINFLGFDGLIAPSARWECDNLIVFADNHSLDDDLEVVGAEDVDWQDWARAAGMI